MKRLVIAAALVVTGCSGSAPTRAAVPPTTDLLDDARITTCAMVEPGLIRARGSVTNRDTATSNFHLHLVFSDAAGRDQRETVAYTEPVPPGGQKRWEEIMPIRDDVTDPVCTIVEVERFSRYVP